MSNIADAIAAAKAAAGEIVNAATAASGGQVMNYVPAPTPGRALGLDDLLSGSFSVNAWLKVNEFGLFIGKDKTPFQEIDCYIDLSQVQYCRRVRYGNPATYRTTYDGGTDSRGGTWAETMMLARQVDPKAAEYKSADIPFTMLKDLKGKGGDVLISEGQKLGHNLSITGWSAWADFIRALMAKGLDAKAGKVRLKLGYTPNKNAKGEWGVIALNDPQPLAD